MLVVFCVGTFFVMVTMLNMLIAIMGDTFGKVYAIKEVKANKARLKFVGEFEANGIRKIWTSCCCCRKTVEPVNEEQQEFFVFVAKKVSADDAQAEASATQVDQKVKQLQERLDDMQRALESR